MEKITKIKTKKADVGRNRFMLQTFIDNMKEEGYTIKELNDFVYIGGSGYYTNDHTRADNEIGFKDTPQYNYYMRFWKDYLTMKEIRKVRPDTNKCICGHDIMENCWLIKENGNTIDIAPVIGNCCIKNFLPELKIKHCDICNAEHNRWKYSVCKECEKKKKNRIREKNIREKAKIKRERFNRMYGIKK